MSFRLMDTGWDKELSNALAADRSSVRVISPFIKEKAARRLLEHGRPQHLEVITRYDLDGFCDGVSDISALRCLLEAGARIRGIKNLHAKAYLTGGTRSIVTSANLTEQGLLRNHEFGFSSDEAAIAASCHAYFERLWKHGRTNLTSSTLDKWERRVTKAWTSGVGTKKSARLGDEGEEAGLPAAPDHSPQKPILAEQGFVKFFGTSRDRFELSESIFDEVDTSGCYFACNYPANKRPRAVKDGAVMFLARLTKNPIDIVIFGRAVGKHYEEGSDDASAEDIAKRSWKVDWPHYIRVHNAEFIDGPFSNGIPLSELMKALGSQCFAATARNVAAGHGNTEPRRAFNQQAAVELTPAGIVWLTDRLERAFFEKGRIGADRLAKLDWPKV